jgi:hypothetical protein
MRGPEPPVLGGPTRRFNKIKVFEHYTAIAGDLIIRDLLTKYASASGFSARNVQSGAASIPEASFAGEDLDACCRQIADYLGWSFFIDDWDDVHFEDPRLRYASSLLPSRYHFDTLNYEEDITQNRTRIIHRCGGGSTTQDYNGSTAASLGYIVDSITWYRVGQRVMVNDFKSSVTAVNTGTKTVTLAPPVPYKILQGTKIAVLVTRDDLAAQARIARMTDTDGVFEHYLSDETINEDTGITRSDANLVRFNKESATGDYSTWTNPKTGDRLRIELPHREIWGEFVIQQVESSVRLDPDYVQSTVTFSDTLFLRFMNLIRAQARKRKDK